MKTKKFKFEQRVTSIVEMNYLYKVDAKSYEEAEAKIKEAFDKKLKKGTESSPMKKYLSKYKVMDTMLAASELLEKSTLNIKYKPEKNPNFLKNYCSTTTKAQNFLFIREKMKRTKKWI